MAVMPYKLIDVHARAVIKDRFVSEHDLDKLAEVLSTKLREKRSTSNSRWYIYTSSRLGMSYDMMLCRVTYTNTVKDADDNDEITLDEVETVLSTISNSVFTVTNDLDLDVISLSIRIEIHD